ncbi:universal stress protein [Saccharopolyspora phatthalungensis]|uniref:Nucleotide-binding universal stress UspA family protein n=1 Tax=Saccharopolyspora phatthalungensis TaxID=664693 RepID=A0A840QCL8_9PSEU|nr:universal stress protein [Saccharopolyspora phatthalungensis]MBB5157530.1 nucleotide-binding universal stress UspA family protein [Saccharopolyspora phatthalungensis]
MTADRPVVAGVDGSVHSIDAAMWAAGEVRSRRAQRLRLVMATSDPLRDDEAWDIAEAVVGQLKARHPCLEISPEVVPGHPAEVLVRQSDDAQLVVVGSRGQSALSATLIGSVSTKVAMHARCPIVIVRDHRNTGPVVVGLDNSPFSHAALQFAFDAAARYEAELVAMRVWRDVGYAPSVPTLSEETTELREQAQRGLAQQLSGWAERYPDVSVHKVVQRGHPVAELAAASAAARLLVVGHRGRGEFTGLLGSVAAGVIRHASCPVAVVRGERR